MATKKLMSLAIAEQHFQSMWQAYVPSCGAANTVKGELIRAIGRLEYEYSNNGNCNASSTRGMFAYFLLLIEEHVPDVETETDLIRQAMKSGNITTVNSKAYEILKRKVVSHVVRKF
jgi:hypothetical protein